MSEQPNLFSHSPAPVETEAASSGVADQPLFRSAGASAAVSDAGENPADDSAR